ncbi:glutathione hydrolase 3-like isoform X2 [Olea europaea var. sylvestris]|uniref:glutathione hydrolase 3-like isoform X2 n=1 Tax=Olea europaea var. sylvestris TaxID=158386 RepID=UPI000C1D32D8|nr:glutathione hydrolase 3-like isoform X2 [Olea europaea var. sylvestris]
MEKQDLEFPFMSSDDFARRKRWSRALWFLLGIIAIASVGLAIKGDLKFLGVRNDGKYNGRIRISNSDIVESQKAVVAADDGRCSEIGISILKMGGHAVDATVATALCLGVVNPMASGIGGGGFMVVLSSSTSDAQAFDMRETAPAAASQNMYDNNAEAKCKGALSMGVPGEVAGLYMAWLKYGRLPWKTLVQPAIKFAKQGFEVAPYLGSAIAKNEELIMTDLGLRQVYAPKGKLLKAGDTCYNVELGNSLEAVAEQGPEAFYKGKVGEKLVEDVRRAGGILTMEDLRNYRVDVTDAVAVNVMGYRILGMPPPSSGTVGLSLILNILESYGSPDAVKGPLGLHRLIEALKHMFAIRMYLGDPHFENVDGAVSDMLSPDFAKSIREKIFDNTTFPPEYYMYRWNQLRDHGTSHFGVVDSDRNAVSMTTTVNYPFGGGVLSPSTGIVLNNEMDDFSTPTETSPDRLPPAPTNFIRPNKRPLSSMTPIIVLKDNQLAGVIGGSGGLNIIPAVVQVFINHFVLGMDPLAAVRNARVYHKLIPNVVSYENWTVIDGEHIELSEENKQFLTERGHHLQGKAGGAICQLIVQNLTNSMDLGRKVIKNEIFHGVLTAVSDPRKDGRPAAI